ncbi:alkaline ceramidase 3-like [Mytilus californianus]|uniref:alkaline ceramidase 3-like n=1 Tax=Mytilus californianus TaxID=6549 RepID=UPI0022460222|nr:alkaline ceramidase 3-like [Mytilus californianus]
MAPRIASGFWGIPTSTIDWCEENYSVTTYIAEFWNTISNFIFIIPSLAALYFAFIDHMDDRYKWCNGSVLTVGLGSWCFHMTLLYSMQLLDELPMIYGSAFLIYSHLEVEKPRNHENIPLKIILTMYCLFVTIVYLLTKHVLFFQLSYGFVVVSMSVVCCNNFRKYREARNIFIVATVTYAFGFLLWEIDQNFCGGLKLWRSEVLGPFAPIFELHAWWHLLAGTGTYLSVLYSAYLRSLVLGNKPEIKYWKKVWPYIRITNGKAMT